MPEVAERSTVEILRAARERISDPERWTQGRLSDTLHSRSVASFKKDRELLLAGGCWCLTGAIGCESPTDQDWEEASRFITWIAGGLATFNDSHSHPEVLAALDDAIQLAEQEAIK
jgi:hypothetical protein